MHEPLKPLVMGMYTSSSYSSSTRSHKASRSPGAGWEVDISRPSACIR